MVGVEIVRKFEANGKQAHQRPLLRVNFERGAYGVYKPPSFFKNPPK